MTRERMPATFVRLSWASLLAESAEQVALAAAPLTAVLLFRAGPETTGWLTAAQTLPFLLLSLPAGALADRRSQRGLLVGSETVRALSLATIVVLLLTGRLSFLLLVILGFTGAVGTVCFTVAAPAITPRLLPHERLMDGNRWLELGRSAACTAGPALGGAIVGWSGAPLSYVIATACSITALTFVLRLPAASAPAVRLGRTRERSDRERGADDNAGLGIHFVARHALLRPIFVTAVVFNLAWFMLQAVYVAYAVQRLHLTATQVGISLGVYGLGMLIGAGSATWLSHRFRLGTAIVLGPISGLAGAVVMASTLFVGGTADGGAGMLLACVAFFLFGAGPIVWSVTTTTLRQAVTPGRMLGRVSALIATATFGARPVGAALGALVTARFGVGACLLAATVGFAIQLSVIALSRVRLLRELPADVNAPQPAPAAE